MDLDLTDKTALVTGSTRGIGLATAIGLAQMGAEVIVNGRDKAKTESTAAEIAKATGAKVIPVIADVGTAEGQKALFAAIILMTLGTGLRAQDAGPVYQKERTRSFRVFTDLLLRQEWNDKLALVAESRQVSRARPRAARRRSGRWPPRSPPPRRARAR